MPQRCLACQDRPRGRARPRLAAKRLSHSPRHFFLPLATHLVYHQCSSERPHLAGVPLMRSASYALVCLALAGLSTPSPAAEREAPATPDEQTVRNAFLTPHGLALLRFFRKRTAGPVSPD